MADQQIGNQLGTADRAINGGTNPTNVNSGGNNGNQATAEDATVNFMSIATMRARLTAINAGYYTAARLNQMTYNDMMYAIRLNDFATTI